MASQPEPAQSLQPSKSPPPPQCMYKSRLQEYAQKSGMPLPIYHNVNEGKPHEHKHVSTVLIGGETYTSGHCRTRKEAEQNAARLAMDAILKKIEDEPLLTVNEPNLPQCTYKSRLQEYAQKSAMSIPSYHCVNEGNPHEYRHKSVVLVGGEAYTSEYCRNRKEAEQNAAKVAMDALLKKMKDEPVPIIHEDIFICKKILNEFAAKMNADKPIYTTVPVEGPRILFISTVLFHGKTYTSSPGRNKKEAENLAARDIIQKISGTESGPIIYQIVNSKRKNYTPLPKASDNNVLPVLPQAENSAEVESVPENPSVVQALKKPKLEQICETSSGSIMNMTPVIDQPPSADNAGPTFVQGTSSGTMGRKKTRKKNKKKGHAEMLVDRQLPLCASPMIQSSPCPVAQ